MVNYNCNAKILGNLFLCRTHMIYSMTNWYFQAIDITEKQLYCVVWYFGRRLWWDHPSSKVPKILIYFLQRAQWLVLAKRHTHASLQQVRPYFSALEGQRGETDFYFDI